ncbi:MAG: hypothetical protein Q8J76_13460, partial [Desulfobulbaceae bacterium]|nr:hypothetical protein [Desulfobulbaceae bacterium]
MARSVVFRIIPPIDTYPSCVDLAQKITGKVLMIVVFSFGLFLHTSTWFYTSSVIAVMTFLPQFRPLLLVVAAFGGLLRGRWLPDFAYLTKGDFVLPGGVFFKPLIVLAVLVLFAIYYRAVRQGKGRWLGLRPIRNLLVGYVVLIVLVAQLPSPSPLAVVLWAFVIVFGK